MERQIDGYNLLPINPQVAFLVHWFPHRRACRLAWIVIQILETIQWHGSLCAVEKVPLAIPLERYQSIVSEVVGFPWDERLV